MFWDETEGNICDFEIARRRRTPRGRRPRACVETPRTGIGRSQVCLGAEGAHRPHRKVQGRNPVMHGPGKSDSPIVPEKSPNKAGRPAAEGMGFACPPGTAEAACTASGETAGPPRL